MTKPIQYVLRQTIVTDAIFLAEWTRLQKELKMSAKQADYTLWLTVISKDQTAYKRKLLELMPAHYENEVTEEVTKLLDKLGWRLFRNGLQQVVSNALLSAYVNNPGDQELIDSISSAFDKVKALPVNQRFHAKKE